MAKKINGITIAINADTSGVTAGLKELTSQSVSLSKQLKTVDQLLKLDPENTELLATKQKLLAQSVETSRKKLDALRGAQEDVKKAVASGSIGTEEYVAFQKEIVQTEKRLKDLESQDDDTGKSMTDLGNDTKKTGDQMDDTEKKSGKLSEALKTGISAAAKAAGAALAAAGAAAGKLVKDVIESTGELEQNLGGSESVFAEYAGQMQKAGEEAYKNLGISQSEYLATANKMGALLQGSGISAEKSADITEKAMQRAADMASVMGIDMSSAMESVAGAAKGNFTMMDNLGVAINDTTLKAYAAEHGLGELETTQDKVTAAMQMFLETTEQYDGNFAKEATETISGSFGLLSASWKSMIAGLGNSEADIENLAGNVMDALESVVDNIAPVLENIVAALPKVLDKLLKSIDKLLPKLLPMVTKIFEQVLDTLIKLIPKLAPVAVKIIGKLVETITKNLPKLLEAAGKIIMQLVQGISSKLPTLVPAAISMLMELVNGLLDHVDAIVDGAIAIVNGLTDGIMNALPMLIEKAPEIIQKIVQGIVDAAPKIMEAGEKIIDGLVDYLFGEEADEHWSDLIQAAAKIIQFIWDGIVSLGKNLGGYFDKFAEKIADAMGLGDFYRKGRQMIQDIWNGVKDEWEKLKARFEAVGEWIYDSLHKTVGAETRKWANEQLIAAGLDTIEDQNRNAEIEQIRQAMQFGEYSTQESRIQYGTNTYNSKGTYEATPENYAKRFKVNGVPIFGSGGVVNVPTRAIIGENGAEVVMPLEHNTAWIDKLAARINRSGGGYSAQITVNVYGNDMSNIGNTIAEKIDTALRRYQVQQVRGQGGTAWGT